MRMEVPSVLLWWIGRARFGIVNSPDSRLIEHIDAVHNLASFGMAALGRHFRFWVANSVG